MNIKVLPEHTGVIMELEYKPFLEKPFVLNHLSHQSKR
jgi:hypothetical protein